MSPKRSGSNSGKSKAKPKTKPKPKPKAKPKPKSKPTIGAGLKPRAKPVRKTKPKAAPRRDTYVNDMIMRAYLEGRTSAERHDDVVSGILLAEPRSFDDRIPGTGRRGFDDDIYIPSLY